MIGYVLQQELGNELPQDRRFATLLTQIEVDPADPAFADPTYCDWGTPAAAAIRRAGPEALAGAGFAAGSMGPKVEAARRFVAETGGLVAIGSIADAAALVRGEAGTTIAPDASGLELAGMR